MSSLAAANAASQYASEPYLGESAYKNHGRRVVEGQRLMQSSSDIFLGWYRLVAFDGLLRDFYVRQLWDGKYSPDVETLGPALFTGYARLCGRTLARAHARSGDRIGIAAYLDQSEVRPGDGRLLRRLRRPERARLRGAPVAVAGCPIAAEHDV